MIEFDEDGLPVQTDDPSQTGKPLAFQPRLYRALVELADIVAEVGYFTQTQLVEVINKWSIDPPLPTGDDLDPNGIEVGLDQMKLFHAIEHQESADELIEAHVLHAIKEYEEQPDFEAMDQVDLIIYDQERELEKNGQGVAYLTACLNQDADTSHDIINEMGCTLTHLLTQWFLLYMISHEETEGDETPFAAVRRRVGIMGMENAKEAAKTPSQRREALEEQIERFKKMTGFYDQEDGDEDAPQ